MIRFAEVWSVQRMPLESIFYARQLLCHPMSVRQGIAQRNIRSLTMAMPAVTARKKEQAAANPCRAQWGRVSAQNPAAVQLAVFR